MPTLQEILKQRNITSQKGGADYLESLIGEVRTDLTPDKFSTDGLYKNANENTVANLNLRGVQNNNYGAGDVFSNYAKEKYGVNTGELFNYINDPQFFNNIQLETAKDRGASVAEQNTIMRGATTPYQTPSEIAAPEQERTRLVEQMARRSLGTTNTNNQVVNPAELARINSPGVKDNTQIAPNLRAPDISPNYTSSPNGTRAGGTGGTSTPQATPAGMRSIQMPGGGTAYVPIGSAAETNLFSDNRAGQAGALQNATQPTAPSITQNLTVGSRGDEVVGLQKWLIAQGFTIPDGATGYYGPQTKAAVEAWQRKIGLAVPEASQYGHFGPLSRAAMVQPAQSNPQTGTTTPVQTVPSAPTGSAGTTQYPTGSTGSTGVTPGNADAAFADYLKNLAPSGEETNLENQIINNESATNLGVFGVSQKPIARPFLQGYSKAIEMAGNIEANTLKDRLALAQGKRAIALDVSKAKYDREREKEQKTGEIKPEFFELSEGQSRYQYDPATGQTVKIAEAPKTVTPKAASTTGGSGSTTVAGGNFTPSEKRTGDRSKLTEPQALNFFLSTPNAFQDYWITKVVTSPTANPRVFSYNGVWSVYSDWVANQAKEKAPKREL